MTTGLDRVEGDSARIERAAEWLAKLDAVTEIELSRDEWQAWDEWAADERNRAAFDALTLTRQQVKASKPERLPWPSAADLHSDRASDDDLRYSMQAESDELPTGSRHGSRRIRAWRAFGLAAAIAASVSCVAIYIRYQARHAIQPAVDFEQTYTTLRGQQRSVTLPDGSSVVLGADSALSVSYTERQRAIALNRGEAIFTVARNATRPFRVHAAGATITALGTEFDVLRNPRRVVVTVTQGSVEVAPAAPILQDVPLNDVELSNSAQWLPVRVERGQEMSYEPGGKANAVERTDPQIRTAWRRGTLVYRSRPLSEVMEDVRRYWGDDVRLEEGVGDLLYSGTVGEHDIGAWVKGLEQVFPVTVTNADSGTATIELRKIE